jgi:FkbM family methyltransferase
MNYSQNSEQDIILNYFQSHKGTFIDLGANDGITFSNTRALAEAGWSGVLIDASPKAFQKLQENYKNKIDFHLYNIAIGMTNGIAKFHESGSLIGTDDVALVSTFHQHEMDRFKSAVQYEEIEAKCLTWSAFLAGCPIKDFDFISMDIEGNEMDVLPFMDLANTKMICIEYNGNEELKRDYEKYLFGFNLIYTSGENLIYAR